MIQENASKRMTDVQMARNIVNTGNKQLNQHVFSALKKIPGSIRGLFFSWNKALKFI